MITGVVDGQEVRVRKVVREGLRSLFFYPRPVFPDVGTLLLSLSYIFLK